MGNLCELCDVVSTKKFTKKTEYESFPMTTTNLLWNKFSSRPEKIFEFTISSWSWYVIVCNGMVMYGIVNNIYTKYYVHILYFNFWLVTSLFFRPAVGSMQRCLNITPSRTSKTNNLLTKARCKIAYGDPYACYWPCRVTDSWVQGMFKRIIRSIPLIEYFAIWLSQ